MSDHGPDPTHGRYAAPPVDTKSLGRRLRTFVVDELEQLEARHAPGWELPRVLGGHLVAPDVRADLLFTVGLVAQGGVDAVAGTPCDDIIVRQLAEIDGAGTHTFFSYRVAETLAERGPFEQNPLLDGLDEGARSEVALACDSTEWIPLLDGTLPRNYAAVLARCERARRSLGLAVDDEVLRDLQARTVAMLSSNPEGWLDDSEDGTGSRYDMYTVDVYLFTEAMRDDLGAVWHRGLASALRLVGACAPGTGEAVSWGRSTGLLGRCHTIELAVLAMEEPGVDERHRWLALAGEAAHGLQGWFHRGLTTAHQHRSPYGYRGPARRLQLTLDVLGKLAWAANRLEALDLEGPAGPEAAHPERDVLVVLDPTARAAAWGLRTRGLALSLPLVGTVRSDYLPAPRQPGLFEVPVDRPMACWLPTVWSLATPHAPAGPPDELDHTDGSLTASWHRLTPVTGAEGGLDATRRSTHRVEGRTLVITEELEVDHVPEAVSVTVPEAAGRPLRVEVTGSEHRLATVDTDGVKEWRSFWGPLPRVHELDLVPDRRLAWTMRVTPLWRVASEAGHHHYHRSLYDPLVADVVEHRFARHHLDGLDAGRGRLADVDLFHLHWPEWFFGPDQGALDRFASTLDDARVRLVWTQHNLVPHLEGDYHDLYQGVAERADLVLHHSRWGMERARSRYRYRPDAHHVVLPHGHFGHLLDETPEDERSRAEAQLGLEPCRIRLGIVGAPRRDKHTAAFAEAFARAAAPDVQLLVLSLGPDEVLPDDPRITGLPYEFVDRSVYDARLSTLDAVVLPFDVDGEMLTTGVVGDVVGRGLPAVCSAWPYAVEALGDAAIVYHDLDEIPSLVDTLEHATLASAATHARRLAAETDFAVLGHRLLEAFEALGTRKL